MATAAHEVREDAAPAPEGRGRVLAAVCAVLFLTFLDTTIVSVALADIQSTLHAGVSQLQWVVNAYALVFASLLLAGGSLGDRLGRKRIMLAGVAVFGVGSLLGALAPNVTALIAARGIMGLGAAASEPGTLSVIRHVYPERASRARALGVWAAVSGLALALGPVVGGVLVGIGGWRDVFWFNLVAGLVLLVAAAVTVPETADPRPVPIDLAGLVLAPLALGAMVVAVILGETRGYADALIVALFAVGAALGIAFVLAESRNSAPVFDLRYLRKSRFSSALAVAFATYFGIFAVFFFAALYLQVVVGYSAYRVAGLFVPMAAAMIVASLVTGPWVGRAGARRPMAIGCLLAGLGILAADVILSGQIDFVLLAAALAIAGVGFGITIVPITSVALGEIPPRDSGMAASATITSRELGSVVGVAVLGSLVNGYLTTDLGRRLAAIGVPPPFRDVVISAVERGEVPRGGAASAQQTYGSIVARVIDAAYGAFRDGLTVSLLVAGLVILAAGLLSWLTLSHSRAASPRG